MCVYLTLLFSKWRAETIGPFSFKHKEIDMFYAIVWFTVAGLLALWSGGLWAVDALAHWSATQAGQVSVGAAGLPALQLPAWLAPWVPPELADGITAALAGLAPWLDGLLGFLPAIAGGVTVLLWVVWAFGALLLLALGVALHLGIAAWRRRARSAAAAGGNTRGLAGAATGLPR